MLEDQVEGSEDRVDHLETFKQQKSKTKTTLTGARRKLLRFTL